MLTDHHRKRIREAQEAVRRRQQVADLGEYFLDLEDWCWFGTATLSRPRSSSVALAAVKVYLKDLEHAAGRSIGWVVAESRGGLFGRLHFHFLISEVDHLEIEKWRAEANRRLGNTQIESYDPSLGGAHYLAQNALAAAGDWHFQRGYTQKLSASGRVTIAPSAEVHSRKQTLGRRRSQ